MKIFEAMENQFYINSMQKTLSVQGSSNSEIVCFSLNRYAGKADLAECCCTIKTKNSIEKSDVVLPEVQALDDKIKVLWKVSSASTSVPGKLMAQIQFEKIFDDNTKNIVWQSNIMEFIIGDSLDSANEVYDQNPTMFQQWEGKVNTTYSDVSASVKTAQTVASQIQTIADIVATQEENVLQAQVQVSQKAQDSQSSAQSSQNSASAALVSANQAKTSETNAVTAEYLSKGYANAANTYSEAAASSALTAQQQASSAKADADRAQHTADSFAGYTKQETNNNFANAFVGEATGQTVSLDDVQPNTYLNSLLINGQTSEIGIGEKSPDHSYALSGTTQLTLMNSASQSQSVTLPQTLYRLPNGTHDTYDAVSGAGTQRVAKVIMDGSENWSVSSFTMTNYARFYRSNTIIGVKQDIGISDKFLIGTRAQWDSKWEGEYINACNSLNGESFLCILKSRLTGWSDSWSNAQKVTAFKAWLSAHNVTVLYELAAPIMTQGIGQHFLIENSAVVASADNGTLTIQYNRDSIKVLNKLENEIAALKMK